MAKVENSRMVSLFDRGYQPAPCQPYTACMVGLPRAHRLIVVARDYRHHTRSLEPPSRGTSRGSSARLTAL